MKGRPINSRVVLFLRWGTFAVIAAIFSACAPRYMIKSYPEGATVYVKNVVTGETKKLGVTPLTIKKTNDLSDVFYISLEKDNYFPKQVLVTPRDGDNMTMDVTLNPVSKNNRAIAGNPDQNKQGSGQGKGSGKQGQQLKNLAMRVALLENTLSLYKDALFSGRYGGGGGGGGYESYDRGTTDQIVDHLFMAQQNTMLKKYNAALKELDQALLLDEYLPQAYLIKGSIYFLTKRYNQAKLAWQRCLKIDPYNAQAYQYLRLVSKKLGVPQPPDNPAMLRAPASAPYAKSLR